MNPEQKIKLIQEKFDSLGDWEARYTYIIEKGRALPPFPEKKKSPENLVKGCQSQVWLSAELESGKVHFDGDSDALLVKGLVALILDVFEMQPPAVILATSFQFVSEWGLAKNLTPSRANGVVAVITQIKNYAIAYQYLLSCPP